jgi:ElaB/YqjD/DUF883 family membrane-anchored ribosome-binding protein
MDNESEVMCQQMEETRTSLQGKLETLEQQVKDTVQETTDAVTGTVDAVKETVESVKDTVQETVQSIRDTLNLNHMVNEHPWLMFAGAAGVGFVGARLLGSISSTPTSSDEPARPAPRPEASPHRNGFSASSGVAPAPAPPQPSWWHFIAEHYSEELAKLKDLAIATVGNVVRETLTKNAAPEIAARTRKMIDGLVTKLGATPIQESISNAGAAHEEGAERELSAHEGNLKTTPQ